MGLAFQATWETLTSSGSRNRTPLMTFQALFFPFPAPQTCGSDTTQGFSPRKRGVCVGIHAHHTHAYTCTHTAYMRVHACTWMWVCTRAGHTHTHNCEFSSDGPEDQEGSRLRGPTCRKLGRRAPRSLELRVAAFPAASSAAASGGRPVPGPLARMLSHFSSLIGTLSPCGNPKQILRGRIACLRPAVGSDSARPRLPSQDSRALVPRQLLLSPSLPSPLLPEGVSRPLRVPAPLDLGGKGLRSGGGTA